MNLQKKFDLCVVGGGPAGIITILEYQKLNPNKSIVLIEFGSAKSTRSNTLDDSIINVNKQNHHDPYNCTNKGLGGTSLTWGGRCVMYDKIDFITREIINSECTWDIELFEDVQKYIQKAADYFECGEATFDLSDIDKFKDKRIAENFKNGQITDTKLERYSKPTRFGSRYKKDLRRCKNLTILLGKEAVKFDEPDGMGKVTKLFIKDTESNRVTEINAQKFVIAAGTQESTRLLLRNTQLFKNLSAVPTALGKYYQCHLFGKLSSVVFYGDPSETEFGFLKNSDGTYMRRRFQFTTEYILENDLLNCAFWLDNPSYIDYQHKNGAMSLMYLLMITPYLGKKLAPPAIQYIITKGKVSNLKQHIFNVIRGIPNSLLIPARIFFKRYCLRRKLPGVFLFNPRNEYALYFHSEQIPRPCNRMELDAEENLVIHYNIAHEEVDSIIKMHEKIDIWLRQCNCGELKYWHDRDALSDVIMNICKDGVHQIGTTRIADSPALGVVNRDLKLWGTENVFVCSSSVFPTSSQANPTFFLGAFAIRLAKIL